MATSHSVQRSVLAAILIGSVLGLWLLRVVAEVALGALVDIADATDSDVDQLGSPGAAIGVVASLVSGGVSLVILRAAAAPERRGQVWPIFWAVAFVVSLQIAGWALSTWVRTDPQVDDIEPARAFTTVFIAVTAWCGLLAWLVGRGGLRRADAFALVGAALVLVVGVLVSSDGVGWKQLGGFSPIWSAGASALVVAIAANARTAVGRMRSRPRPR